jgi:hypothetical protein
MAAMGYIMLAVLFAALLYGAARVRAAKRKNQANVDSTNDPESN